MQNDNFFFLYIKKLCISKTNTWYNTLICFLKINSDFWAILRFVSHGYNKAREDVDPTNQFDQSVKQATVPRCHVVDKYGGDGGL